MTYTTLRDALIGSMFSIITFPGFNYSELNRKKKNRIVNAINNVIADLIEKDVLGFPTNKGHGSRYNLNLVTRKLDYIPATLLEKEILDSGFGKSAQTHYLGFRVGLVGNYNNLAGIVKSSDKKTLDFETPKNWRIMVSKNDVISMLLPRIALTVNDVDAVKSKR